MRRKTYEDKKIDKKRLMIFTTILLVSFSSPAGAVHHQELKALTGDILSGDFEFPGADSSRTEGIQLPVILNDSVEAYIDQFTSEKTTFQAGLNKAVPYLPVMKKIFRDEKLPEELVYVAMIESWFDPVAVSRSNAVGPWQFMPGTARGYGLVNDEWIDERRDHVKSTRAAAKHFRALHAGLRSWTLALAAYNAGMRRVRQAMFGAGSGDFWDLKQSTYLNKETKTYVPKILAATIILRNPQAYGFQVPDHKPLSFDVVELRKSTDLRVIAELINSSYSRIKLLNPEIKGHLTPPRSYKLKIPEGTKKIFVAKNGYKKEIDQPFGTKSLLLTLGTF